MTQPPVPPRGMLSELHAEIARLRGTLEGIAEFCSGDDNTLSAISRLAAIRNTAERAIRGQCVEGEKK